MATRFTHFRGVVFTSLLLVVVTLSGCDCCTSAPASGKPVIVVSISPLADLVRELTEDVASVHTLLPSGISPHGFSLTADQMRWISRADVAVLNGLGVDAWAEPGLQRAGSAGLLHVEVATVLGVKTDHYHHHHHDHDHDCDHEGPNPHYWVDPVRMMQFTTALSQKLQQRFPEQAGRLAANEASLLEKLADLDRAYREQLAEVPQKKLVTFHNAFDLMAQRYGLEVIAHLAEVQVMGLSVTAAEMTRVLQAIDNHALAVIYAEPQTGEQAVKAVQQRAGVKALILDPMEITGKPYFEQMRRNLATLEQGQRMERER